MTTKALRRLATTIAVLILMTTGALAQGLVGRDAVVVAGHSFHAPSARTVQQIARSIGAGDVEVVFVTGPRGSLGPLWNNRRARSNVLDHIQDHNAGALILASAGGVGNEAEALGNWIRAAREISPDIVIVLNATHPPRGRQMSASDYAETSAYIYTRARSLAAQMQSQFPQARITVAKGGFAASAANTLVENGGLPSRTGVFRDRLGHGTQLVYAAQGASWATALYGLSDDTATTGLARQEAAQIEPILRQISVEAAAAEANPITSRPSRGFGFRQ